MVRINAGTHNKRFKSNSGSGSAIFNFQVTD
jgi:hypothetical protein